MNQATTTQPTASGLLPPAPPIRPPELPKDLVRNKEFEQFRDLCENVLSSRIEFLRELADPRRDLNDECGYPNDAGPELYRDLYARLSTAARVVEVLPRESWQVQPMVYEDEDAQVETPFELAWKELGQSLEGESSWYADDRGSGVWEYLSRIDTLSGIGRYGVIFLGLDDGKSLDQPAAFVRTKPGTAGQTGSPFTANGPTGKLRQLLFLRVFPEHLAQVVAYETDLRNPRFGQPTKYLLTFNDPESQQMGIGAGTTDQEVHWTRVVHIADNLEANEVFGIPRMQTVLNHLLDIRKLYGGSAEMYWRGAFPGLSLETHPSLGGDVDVDLDSVKDMMEQYMNRLQRYLSLTGMSAKSLAPQVVDPTAQVNVQIEAICIKLGIPKRVFMGSERGDLASTQDDAAWNDRLKYRQKYYITPKIIARFVNRLIALGILPMPKRFTVDWPDITSQSDQEKSTVALQRTQALAQYLSAGGAHLVSPQDFLARWLGFTEEEAVTQWRNAVESNNQAEVQRVIGQSEAAKAAQQAQMKADAKNTPKDSSGKTID